MTFKIQHRRLIANDVPLHYVVAGEGQPLVLIHGFPQTWHQWNPLIARLALPPPTYPQGWLQPRHMTGVSRSVIQLR